MSGQCHTLATFPPVPIVQEARWASGLIWIGLETSPPPGFRPWTVWPVVISYTKYGILAAKITILQFIVPLALNKNCDIISSLSLPIP